MATKQVFATSYSGESAEWNNVGNIYANDTNLATTGGVLNSDVYFYAHFPSSDIPAGSVVTGVVIRIRFKVSTTSSAHDLYSVLYCGATNLDPWKLDTSEPTTLTDVNMGSVSGVTLTQVNSSDMKAYIVVNRSSATACTYSIDSISMITTYETAGSAVKVNIGGVWKTGTVYVKIGGTWKAADSVKVNIGGTWK